MIAEETHRRDINWYVLSPIAILSSLMSTVVYNWSPLILYEPINTAITCLHTASENILKIFAPIICPFHEIWLKLSDDMLHMICDSPLNCYFYRRLSYPAYITDLKCPRVIYLLCVIYILDDALRNTLSIS